MGDSFRKRLSLAKRAAWLAFWGPSKFDHIAQKRARCVLTYLSSTPRVVSTARATKYWNSTFVYYSISETFSHSFRYPVGGPLHTHRIFFCLTLNCSRHPSRRP